MYTQSTKTNYIKTQKQTIDFITYHIFSETVPGKHHHWPYWLRNLAVYTQWLAPIQWLLVLINCTGMLPFLAYRLLLTSHYWFTTGLNNLSIGRLGSTGDGSLKCVLKTQVKQGFEWWIQVRQSIYCGILCL